MSPIAGIIVTLSLLALVIAVLIIGAYVRRRRRRGIRLRWAEAAQARGWSYSEQDGHTANAFGGKPFRRGVTRSPKALDVISGRLGDHPVVAFRYRYRRGANPDNLSDVYSCFTVCAVRLPDQLTKASSGRMSVEIARPAKRALRGTRYRIEGSYLLCWERSATTRVEVAFARLDALAGVLDGRDGRIRTF